MKPYKTQAIGGVLGKEGWGSGSLAKDQTLTPSPFHLRQLLSSSFPRLGRCPDDNVASNSKWPATATSCHGTLTPGPRGSKSFTCLSPFSLTAPGRGCWESKHIWARMPKFLPVEGDGVLCAALGTQKCSSLFPALPAGCRALRWEEPVSLNDQPNTSRDGSTGKDTSTV